MTADAAPTSAGAVRDLAGRFRAVLGVCVGLQVVAGCNAARIGRAPAPPKSTGVATRAGAPASCPDGTREATPLPEGANRPLAGITVLDFGQVYQGPYATLLMAKAGADVIKIEPPQGEPLRRRAPPGKSTTFPIAMLNSNKRAITLNLKHERGRALLFRMVERGDVLLENFAPGVMDRLGVGWEVLHRINPRLVYASGSGYGLTGPDRDNLAMDLTIQAVSGLIAATGFPDGPPVKAGPAVVDFISGIHLYAATMTALFERERTGRGRLVEVAMQEAAYATLTSQLHAYFEPARRRRAPATPATAACR